MLKVIQVIPAKVWKHKKTGLTASISSGPPWRHECEMLDWTMEQVGWTWQMSDGTIGNGCIPAPTMELALEAARKFNERA